MISDAHAGLTKAISRCFQCAAWQRCRVHAMRNLLGIAPAEPYRHIPYFWSDWYGHRIQFVGVPTGEPEIVTGSWDSDEFAALYRDGDRLVGALTLDRRADIMKYRAMIGRRATWSDAREFAASRRQPTASVAASA